MIRFLPIRWRAIAVADRIRPWMQSWNHAANLSDEVVPSMLFRAETLCRDIGKLGFIVPDTQLTGEGGRESVTRLASYLGVFLSVVDGDANRFGKKTINDTKWYLEDCCAKLKARHVFRHMGRNLAAQG